MDAVSPILVDRAREPRGIRLMIGVSLGVHAVATVLILIAPPLSSTDTTPKTVMTISLGASAPGPRTGGQESISGREAEKATDVTKSRPAPEAAKPPAMVLPKASKPEAVPKATAKFLQDEKPRAVPKAAEASSGDARLQTTARTLGFGLSSGGAGTSGYLDVANFCCPEYLSTMVQLIQRNWNGRQDVSGETMIKFTVQRDGRITSVQMERSSGFFALDQTAERALLVTRQLPPLPQQFTEPTLTVHLNFKYEH